MTYYLYAGSPMHPELEEVIDIALVGEYDTEERAKDQKRLEEMCYADDGHHYVVSDTPLDPPPNTSYDELIKRYSK